MPEYPEPVTGGLIFNDRGEVFLMQSPKWDNHWIVPGGHVEHGEDLTDSLRREIREETGMEVTNLRLVTVMTGEPDSFERDTSFVYINYACQATSTDVELDQREGTDYVWVTPEKALALDLNTSTERFIRDYLDSDQA